MAAGLTYEPIATASGTGSSTQITFSSISGSYTDLILRVSNIDVQIDNMGLRFNSDSGSNYSRTRIIGNGSSVTSANNSNQTYLYFGYKDTTASTSATNHIVQIQNYSNSTTYKAALTRYSTNNSSGYNIIGEVALWRSTSAITQIDIYSGNANFSTNCKFTLYGITKA